MYLQLRLSVLNSSKTAYSAFVFDADSFFESYSFGAASGRSSNPDKFCCEIYLKVGIQNPHLSSQANVRPIDAPFGL